MTATTETLRRLRDLAEAANKAATEDGDFAVLGDEGDESAHEWPPTQCLHPKGGVWLPPDLLGIPTEEALRELADGLDRLHQEATRC